MKKTLNMILALGFAASMAGSAFAQTPAAPAAPTAPAVTAPAVTAPKVTAPAVTAPKVTTPTAAAPTTKPAMTAAEKSAKSANCSKQADAKGLHGKERKKFRDTCKKG